MNVVSWKASNTPEGAASSVAIAAVSQPPMDEMAMAGTIRSAKNIMMPCTVSVQQTPRKPPIAV